MGNLKDLIEAIRSVIDTADFKDGYRGNHSRSALEKIKQLLKDYAKD